MSKPVKVLIVGGGITGPVAAYWLARASTPSKPIQITVLERAAALYRQGQGIDIEGPSREVVTRMGLLDIIKSRTTGEKGLRCLDNDNRAYATFGLSAATREIEILRGDLVDILTKAATKMPNVEFRYGSSVKEVEQTNERVHVTIATNDGQTYDEEYDLSLIHI